MLHTVFSPGKTYTTAYTELERLASSSYRGGELIAAKVVSEQGNESFALIRYRNEKLFKFENDFDLPCLLAAYHDRIGTGRGKAMVESVKSYLTRISVTA